jgi:hypothetical protein
LLEKKLEKIDNLIMKFELEGLASKMHGYSPADIDQISMNLINVKHAELKTASHFFQYHNGIFTQCKSTIIGAVPMKFSELPGDYRYNVVTFKDLQNAIKNTADAYTSAAGCVRPQNCVFW